MDHFGFCFRSFVGSDRGLLSCPQNHPGWPFDPNDWPSDSFWWMTNGKSLYATRLQKVRKWSVDFTTSSFTGWLWPVQSSELDVSVYQTASTEFGKHKSGVRLYLWRFDKKIWWFKEYFAMIFIYFAIPFLLSLIYLWRYSPWLMYGKIYMQKVSYYIKLASELRNEMFIWVLGHFLRATVYTVNFDFFF